MKLFVQEFLEASIDGCNLAKHLSRKELNALQARGKTRRQIRTDMMMQIAREAAATENFDAPGGNWDAHTVERAKCDFLRRLSPFLLPEFAHRGMAFVLEPACFDSRHAEVCTAEHVRDAGKVLEARASIYVEFPRRTMWFPKLGYVWAVVMTAMGERSKWSAFIQPASGQTGSAIVTWYVNSGTAASVSDVIYIDDVAANANWNDVPPRVTDFVHVCLARHSVLSEPVQSHPVCRGDMSVRHGQDDTVTEISITTGCAFRLHRLQPARNDSAIASSRRPGKKLEKHIVVAGFRKTVACGKGRKERREIFIEQYHKGPRHLPITTKVPLVTVTPCA